MIIVFTDEAKGYWHIFLYKHRLFYKSVLFFLFYLYLNPITLLLTIIHFNDKCWRIENEILKTT